MIKYTVTAISGTIVDIKVILGQNPQGGSVKFYNADPVYYSTSNEVCFQQKMTNIALPVIAIVLEYTKTAV